LASWRTASKVIPDHELVLANLLAKFGELASRPTSSPAS
jgi:hypothetical protein